MAILNTKQTLLELPHLKLIMDVSTRWNSTFNMLERFLEQQPAIEATLLSKDLKKNFKDVYTMSEDDISTASRVIEVLKPIKKVTTILCAEKSPTVSLIHPLKEMLLQQLRVIQDDDGNFVTAAKEAMIKDLEQRYTDHTMKLFLHESSCIDPRFKAMPYLDDAAKEEVYKSLAQKSEDVVNTIQMISKIKTEKMDDDEQPNLDPTPPLPSMSSSSTSALTNTEASDANSDDSATPCKKSKSALQDLFGEVFVTCVEPAVSLKTRIELELVNYKSTQNMPLDADPLLWWKQQELNFPLLSTLARRYLCIPATSVASERVFSTAGDLVSAQRSLLSSDQIDRLIFLKKNMV
ncbi:E3 SUMO-protein ligase ZBED1-like [Argopecten irradians]|uniref:E3 SUMO-protein ligase ZBED1-like n=1 Tax=Argopecten irradians TaxID=31199 RepID=UPI003718AF11